MRQGSAGFADSLSTLIGRTPKYQMIQDFNREGDIGGGRYNSAQGAIEFTPSFAKDYARQGLGRRGYTPLNRSQKFGDYVLGHEFGHAATHGTSPFTLDLSDALGIDIPQTNEDNERFADDFQNTVEFLRGQSTDTLPLSLRQRLIMNVALRHAPYGEHPINKARKLAER